MLANLATIARDEEAHWEAEVGRILPQVMLPGKPVRGGGRAVSTAVGEAGVAVEIERLKAMDAATRRRVVRGMARGIGSRLSFEETAKVLALAGFGGYAGILGRIGSRLELRDGLRAERSARELRQRHGRRSAPAASQARRFSFQGGAAIPAAAPQVHAFALRWRPIRQRCPPECQAVPPARARRDAGARMTMTPVPPRLWWLQDAPARRARRRTGGGFR